MVEESLASGTSVTQVNQTDSAQNKETLETQASIEATIESAALSGIESTCNNNTVENSAVTSEGDSKKTLGFADELTEKGSEALKESDYAEAVDCFSRALEIRVSHYGELGLECQNAYYQYGRALLYKAQEEADPLGNVPKKGGDAQHDSDKNGSVKTIVGAESCATSVSSNAEQNGSSCQQDEVTNDESGGKDQEESGEDCDADDVDGAEADEEDSDLDFAWKMLDISRAISEKYSGDTMEKVDILSTLAEVSLEREDIESSLADYQNALSILERVVEPDSRHLAELNFRICLCLEIGSQAQEAIPYCQKAISVCKSRLQRLRDEAKVPAASENSSATSAETGDDIQQSSNVSQTDTSITDKDKEIETLVGLAEDLEKKLEDLHQPITNSKSILSELLGVPVPSSKTNGNGNGATSASVANCSRIDNANSTQEFDAPTITTAQTNSTVGVTHLGVVGRGVKRMQTSTTDPDESSTTKRIQLDHPTLEKGHDNAE